MSLHKKISLFFSLIGIAAGVIIALISWLYYEECLPYFFVVIGSILAISHIFPLIISFKEMKYNKKYIFSFIAAIIVIAFGIIYIFLHGMIASIALGSTLTILSLIRILIAKERLGQLIYEIPFLGLAGALFFNNGDLFFKIAVIIYGVSLALVSLANIAYVIFQKNGYEELFNDKEKEEA